MIPHCNLQCVITQPVLRLFLTYRFCLISLNQIFIPNKVEEDARAEPSELLALPVAEGVEPLQRDDDDADRQLPKVVVLLRRKVILLQ